MALIIYRGHKGFKKAVQEKASDLRVPQSRTIKDEHITESTVFTYVDFLPSFCKKVKDRVVYHSFSSLVCLANSWLKENPGWQVVSCETVAQLHAKIVDNVDYSADVYSLRMWIRRADVNYSNHYDMVFWFKDFTPSRNEQDGAFETLEDLIQSINEDIEFGRVNGKILQIESIKVSATDDWKYRSDATYISDGRTCKNINRYPKVILGVRMFFQIGECLEDEIVLVDFVPEFYSNGQETLDSSASSRLKHRSERFSALVKRASEWLMKNPELNFCNAQSIDMRVRGHELPISIDTRNTWWVKETTDRVVRFLRIFCTKPSETLRLAISTGGQESFSGQALTVTAFDQKTFNESVQDWVRRMAEADPGEVVRKISTLETVIVPPFIIDETGASFQHAVDETLLGSPLEGRLKYSFVAVRIYCQERMTV